MQAIILAGGKGSRLKPFTTVIPKPLMPIGDMPVLEVVLRQLKYYGFKDIVIAVSHLSELIMAFFGNGKKLGLKISYSIEDRALGTAGPLTIIDNLDDNFLVMNGDLLTTINFKDFYNYHVTKKSEITIACYNKEVKIDLGVLEVKNGNFTDYIEKPTYKYNVSTGIYIFKRSMINSIEKGKKLDMPDFILRAKQLNRKIMCYQGDYYWLDIGRADDYEQAIEIFQERKPEFLPNG